MTNAANRLDYPEALQSSADALAQEIIASDSGDHITALKEKDKLMIGLMRRD